MRSLEILLGDNFLPEKLMSGIWVISELCVGFGFFFYKGINRIELSILKEKI